MNPEEELVSFFAQTLEDKRFSRGERKALKEVMEAYALDSRKLGVLRSKIFDMARDALRGHEYQQVVDWLEEANKLLIRSAEARIRSEAFFSPGEACLDAILSQLRGARNKVEICVFTISDNRITREIIACAKRGVPIRLITDNEKLHDKGSDIEWLSNEGIPVRVDRSEAHMHHKFALIDEDTLLSGSYNWTRSAAERNEENIVITDNPTLIKRFSREFDQLWGQCVDF